MTTAPKPKRPSYQEPVSLEALAGRNDPIERLHAAHETAALLVRRGHEEDDTTLTARLVAAVEEVGLPVLADLWEDRPANTLPGTLYRLYALRELITLHTSPTTREYVAGLEVMPGAAIVPDGIVAMVDEILSGVFAGDVAEALDKAAAFCLVVGAGRARMATTDEAAEQAARMGRLSVDLAKAAGLWRDGDLE